MINGAISGICSSIISLPFQVISTNMKLINLSQNEKIKTLKMIKTIYKKEGIKGFYRGFIPNLIRITLSDAIFFRVLETSQNILKNKLNANEFLTHTLSSSIAMTSNCIIINPFVVISTRNEKLGLEIFTTHNFNDFHSFASLESFQYRLKLTDNEISTILKEEDCF